ncbi:MAG: hypothetical protein OXU22_09355 [Gammaproteobacteria bacterium]|nr:hypothetical protein [Gammaproteobacteria bacterium]
MVDTVATEPAAATPVHRYLWWLLLLLVLAVSVFIRVQDYPAWQGNPDVYFFDGQPLLLSGDGYHYLRLARDYRDGRYAPLDELRTAPEHPPRPMPVPLLSVLTAAVSAFSPLSLEWAAVSLPVFLSLLLAIPLLMLCRQLHIPPLASLMAVLVALNTHWFIIRTRLGAFDTDCLIVAFVLGAQTAALGFGMCRGWRRYGYLLGAALNAALFAWWWDQAPEAVALICIAPLALSAAFYYRPPRREALIAAGVIAAVAGLLAAGGQLAGLARTAREVLLFGVKGGGATGFPNTADSIAELGDINLQVLVDNTTGFLPTVLLGAGGLLYLLCRQPRAAFTALAVPVVLTLSVLQFGLRGFLFWGPVLGIGVAAALTLPAAAARRFVPQTPAPRIISALMIPAGAALAIAPPLARELDSALMAPLVWPAIPVIQAIDAHTPPDALVWAPWSLGYPIMYYTGRRVLMDGQFMDGERQVYANLPLADPNPALARNFMRFYAARGLSGARRIVQLSGSTDAGLTWIRQWFGQSADAAARSLCQLAGASQPPPADLATPEACRDFLFPDNTDPLYLALDSGQLRGSWFRYGTWDPGRKTGRPSAHQLFDQARREGDTMFMSDDLSFDVNRGMKISLYVDGEEIREPITRFITYTGSALEEKQYGQPGGLHFEWMPHARFGVLMSREVAESVLNRMFIRHTVNPAYFRHAFLQSPTVSLWEVGVVPRSP